MEYNIQKVGQRMRLLRQTYGYTQDQAAEKLGIDRRHLSHIEKGTRGASVDLILRMASLYGVTVDYLLLGQDRQNASVKKHLDALIDTLIALRDSL